MDIHSLVLGLFVPLYHNLHMRGPPLSAGLVRSTVETNADVLEGLHYSVDGLLRNFMHDSVGKSCALHKQWARLQEGPSNMIKNEITVRESRNKLNSKNIIHFMEQQCATCFIVEDLCGE